MPIHDWTRVEAGIFHDFHQSWVPEIARTLNGGLLPPDYYALKEQYAATFGPDVLTLQRVTNDNGDSGTPSPVSSMAGEPGVRLAAPNLQPTAETDMAFYRRKQSLIAIRHISGDRVVAIIEIVSPGNKAANNPLRKFVQKAAAFIESGVHLLIIDVFPPGPRDPQGLDAEIWQEIAGQQCAIPSDKPLTLAAYEAALAVRAYVEKVAVGEPLLDMPLFLEAGEAVMVPLEATYSAAFGDVPRRWRRVLEA